MAPTIATISTKNQESIFPNESSPLVSDVCRHNVSFVLDLCETKNPHILWLRSESFLLFFYSYRKILPEIFSVPTLIS
ncbi:hypothetical protein AR158_C161L [Paramecium bursaria Chlorella virus AR158]|uniref:hypothetical protein n=1 Tax=Paramecium bursaria Chlorella virus AR158 TaxID=380598 RepID=UPI00015AA819|nr:hypothetical protein AR158_C161L [Paramecium bursaria Chlorella virus AR158]ABU43707.1 hypothetical protein AR158_C161L [Paramecium bursaria Chlorella virus AR158]